MIMKLCEVVPWGSLISLMKSKFGILMKQKPPLQGRPAEIADLVNNLFDAKGNKAMWILSSLLEELCSNLHKDSNLSHTMLEAVRTKYQSWGASANERHTNMVEALFPSALQTPIWNGFGGRWSNWSNFRELVMSWPGRRIDSVGSDTRSVFFTNPRNFDCPRPWVESTVHNPSSSSLTRLVNGPGIWPIIVSVPSAEGITQDGGDMYFDGIKKNVGNCLYCGAKSGFVMVRRST